MNNRLQILSIGDAVDMALHLSVSMTIKNKPYNPFYLVGDSGIGKTSIISQYTENKGWGFLTCSPGLETKEKFGGIPDIVWKSKYGNTIITDDKKLNPDVELLTVWSVPEIIQKANALARTKEFVVLLFDDFHICNEDIQNICFELFTYWSLHGNDLNRNVIIILAGNMTSASGAQTILTPILNRTTLIQVEPDFDKWMTEYAMPNNMLWGGISFLYNIINRKYFQEEENINPFGTPRSWTSLFNSIQCLEEFRNDDGEFPLGEDKFTKYIISLAQGCVSEQATADFITYYQIFKNLKGTNEVFIGEIILPEDPVNQYSFCITVTQMLIDLYSKGITTDSSIKYQDFLKYLVDNNYKELAVSSCLYLYMFPGDEKNNVISGKNILKNLMSSQGFDRELFKSICEANYAIGS